MSIFVGMCSDLAFWKETKIGLRFFFRCFVYFYIFFFVKCPFVSLGWIFSDLTVWEEMGTGLCFKEGSTDEKAARNVGLVHRMITRENCNAQSQVKKDKSVQYSV